MIIYSKGREVEREEEIEIERERERDLPPICSYPKYLQLTAIGRVKARRLDDWEPGNWAFIHCFLGTLTGIINRLSVLSPAQGYGVSYPNVWFNMLQAHAPLPQAILT